MRSVPFVTRYPCERQRSYPRYGHSPCPGAVAFCWAVRHSEVPDPVPGIASLHKCVFLPPTAFACTLGSPSRLLGAGRCPGNRPRVERRVKKADCVVFELLPSLPPS